MRRDLNSEKIKYYIGDIRDSNSVSDVISGSNYVFHAAALKQVPSCEFFPDQATETNILGSRNLVDMCLKHGVESLVCLSTDKAVYPINAMGISKAMMEKVARAESRNLQDTVVCLTRYGNVMASRGSVIPLFQEQIQNNLPITITDPEMTRFMMTLNDAVELVLYAFENGNTGDIFVQKSPSSTIGELAVAMKKIYNSKINVKIIGTRHAEKLYETLLTKEEMIHAQDLGSYYRIPADNRDLNYSKYFVKGKKSITNSYDYTSHNTKQLSLNELKKLIKDYLNIPI
jgi:UDP-glucose 4-epimerase